MEFDQSTIGPYRLLRTLGEGGMGVVFEAEQTGPVRRRVAVKILKLGMDTRAFVARFEVERQALAVMDHPNIARVLDAGATAEGRPYYVMERVEGMPLTCFCDEYRLTTRERLALFIQICRAVQHAHQKGVIHRDLKPSNVLVGFQDDRPFPRVIDFGIAKALVGRFTDKTLVTEFGRPIGTPAYMSPEQWSSDQIDIDTRTDIYSLGVMLYELLVGRLPHDLEVLVRAPDVVSMMLRDSTPPAPSTHLRSQGPDTAAVARARRTDPAVLARELRGDLDWITLKAIDPARQRRYETAHALADDIERYLRSEPVLARAPTLRYRAERFLVRHRLGASIAAAALLVVLGFSALTIAQARRLAAERDRAAEAAAKATALNDFLQETLLAPDPIDGLGRDVTVRQALDTAVARLARQRTSSPAVGASVRSAIGWAYFRLGAYDRAEPLLREALRLVRATPRPDSSELARNLLRNAELDARLARTDSAAVAFAEGVALLRRLPPTAGPRLSAALVAQADFERGRGDTSAALTALTEAGALFTREGDSTGLASVQNQLGILEYERGNLETAERHMRATLAFHRRLGDHPLLTESLVNLGALLEDLQRPEEAEALYREGLDIARRTLGQDHDIVTATLNNLGVLLSNQGRASEAQAVLREAVSIDERKLGRDHPAVAIDLLNLARAVCRQPPASDGALLAARAVRILTAHSGRDSWETGQARVVLGTCLTLERRLVDAERELRAGLQRLERHLGPGHWRVDSARARLAELERLRLPG
jgi:serine/threonine protein kinase/Tfp pilus assembly protein PilF